MKHRPNISIQNKINKSLDYFKHLAEENIQPSVKKSTINTSVKTKSKPNIRTEKRNLDNINQHRIDMMNWANREYSIYPDLLIEYSTYYVLTITSYKIIFNNETPTSKDFDIYCDGLRLDVETYDVNVNNEIIITIQKSEAVDDHFDTNNFEIISKFTLI